MESDPHKAAGWDGVTPYEFRKFYLIKTRRFYDNSEVS